VRSIVGRFLEHSRLMEFTNAGEPELWLGSADLMHRNLDRRVETLVRVKDPAVQKELSQLLDLLNAPEVICWELDALGTWHRRPDADGIDAQTELLRRARERTATS
jgi:polyphosphate kinase